MHDVISGALVHVPGPVVPVTSSMALDWWLHSTASGAAEHKYQVFLLVLCLYIWQMLPDLKLGLLANTTWGSGGVRALPAGTSDLLFQGGLCAVGPAAGAWWETLLGLCRDLLVRLCPGSRGCLA